jgi:hemoglobin/transferrin/lactoferrin receptor protein
MPSSTSLLLRTLLHSALTAAMLTLAAPTRAIESSPVAGVVRDATGAVLPDVEVSLLSTQGAIVGAARSDREGGFRIEKVRAGSYVLVAQLSGFAARRVPLEVAGAEPRVPVELTLQPETFRDEVTVTATPGRALAIETTPQRVNVLSEEDVALRAKAVLAQVANEEVGVHLQRTSPTIGGIYVRGLTGAKVNVYLDGVRYTTTAQRGGISTFLNLLEPEAVEAIEVLRGPSSAEYGSDALGGSIQVLTRSPSFSAAESRLSGSWNASFGSADASFGSAVNLGYATPRIGLSGTLAGRRINTLRPGGGLDSHNAVTRFFDLPSSVAIGERLPDTAFSQYGGRLKLNWALSPTTQVMASYLRSQQDGGKRYDQLLGGDGNLVADLRNLMADILYARLEKAGAGPFDRVTGSYSFNTQREERVNQGGSGNPAATITHEPERTVAHGVQASAQRLFSRHSLGVGGDLYLESVRAPSFGTNPATGATAVRRGRVPDGASYDSGGLYVQDVFEAVPGKLRLSGALRFSAASYAASAADSPLVNGAPLWPDDSYGTSAVTFRAGALWEIGHAFSAAANVSRGFRAPDVTDLGTFGLTGSGYEVSNRELEGLGATVGTTADATAVSTGEAVRVLDPEKSLSYELTLRYKSDRMHADVTGFLTDVDSNVAKQSLILPPGAVGLTLAGEPIVRQLASGVVFVNVSSSPVLVRSNFGDARLRGVEASLGADLTPSLFLGGSFTYIHAEDRATGRAPNIEGGTPAPDGWLKLRFAPHGGKRFWIEPYLHAAARQGRLSTLDLEDRRTGATRSVSSIARFFTNGARARGLVGPGADGVAGTADDVLLATGETLVQVERRVLGPSGAAVPLFAEIPGYVVFGVRGAIRFKERHELLFDFENLGDVNYRGISWGMDAPGRGLFLRYVVRL